MALSVEKTVGLLKKYNLVSSVSSNEVYIRCPYSENHKHGDRNRSASFNTKKRVWICYGCQKSGTLVDIVMKYENVTKLEAMEILSYDIKDHVNFKDEARQIRERLSVLNEKDKPTEMERIYKELIAEGTYHPYLSSRGVDITTALLFDVGYFDILNAIMLPIYNLNTYKVEAIQLRYVDDFRPKYVFFDRSHLEKDEAKRVGVDKISKRRYNVFGGQCVDDWSEVIVTEGAFSVLRFFGYGYHNVVATLGTPSPEQLDLIESLATRVFLLFDNDDAGDKYVDRFIGGTTLPIRIPSLEYGETDELSRDKLEEVIASGENPRGRWRGH